jgi:hypothetical protein
VVTKCTGMTLGSRCCLKFAQRPRLCRSGLQGLCVLLRLDLPFPIAFVWLIWDQDPVGTCVETKALSRWIRDDRGSGRRRAWLATVLLLILSWAQAMRVCRHT